MTNGTSGKQCMISGCHNFVVAKDLCETHYKRQLRHGHVLDTRASDWGAREKHPLYRCWNALLRYHRTKTVERWHDLWLFVEDMGDSRPTPKHLLTRRDDALPYGPENFYWREQRVSGDSQDVKAQRREYMRAWNASNMHKLVERELRKRYGIDFDEFSRMLKEQGGVCAICGKEETRVDHRTKKVSRLAVDHDHETGKVRGLLCHGHNNSLGHFDDDPALLTSAICYLAKHSADQTAMLRTAIAKLQATIPATETMQ